MAVAWRFRADDRYCGLCGLCVLRLRVSPATPDGAIWWYLHPNEPLRLRLTWERGPESGPARQTFRPEIDFARSGADFAGDRPGGLRFALEELPGGDTLTVSLRPLFEGLGDLQLPPTGFPGQLHLTTGAGRETRPALLLPPPREIAVACADPTVGREEGVWQLHQSGPGVRVPMLLTSPVPLWAGDLQRAEDCDPEISFEDFPGYARVEPGRPLPFTLRINNTNWNPAEIHRFQFFVDLVGLGPWELGGELAVQEGGVLEIFGANPRPVEVQLGRVVTVSFPLGVRGDGQPVTLTDCALEPAKPEDGEPGWLRVLAPGRNALPLVVAGLAQLVLEVDTRALDRQSLDGRMLRGAVELHDARQRRWTCAVQATLTRPPRLGSFVALDWGNAHVCAAYCVGPGDDAPRPLAFDEEQRHAPESFPADLYFSDLSDPDHPVFSLGHEAARRAFARPECSLRGLKHRFRWHDRVYVQDEQGRGHTYPVGQLVEIVLERLVTLAEAVQGAEIHQLALALPARWPAPVRYRLEAVTQGLAARLQRLRQPLPVHVLPPVIDEASAVALEFVLSNHGRALPDTYPLIVMDCGAGTTTTAVLEVHLPDEPADLRTRFLGVGGCDDFGGDDVTRAVLLLLHDRLTAALQRRAVLLDDQTGKNAWLQELPLTVDGLAPGVGGPAAKQRFQLGRRNWEVLWQVAEHIKRDLCAAEGEGAPPPANPPATSARLTGLADDFQLPVDEDSSFESAIASAFEQDQGTGEPVPASVVAGRLGPRLADLYGRVLIRQEPEEGGTVLAVEVAWSLEHLLDPLEAGDRRALFDELHFNLDQVCEYPLADRHGQPLTVRGRVEDIVRELQWQCGQQRVQPRVILLAGGGCRLPLVARLLRQQFPHAPDLLHYQKEFAKRRVANGLAGYLALRRVLNLDRQLGRPEDVLPRTLGLQKMTRVEGTLRLTFEPIVPAGVPVNAPQVWHPFTVRSGQLRDGEGRLRLVLFAQGWRGGLLEIGACDLANPGPAVAGLNASAVPFVAGAAYEGGLRLCGSHRLELRLALEGVPYGPFVVILAAAEGLV